MEDETTAAQSELIAQPLEELEAMPVHENAETAEGAEGDEVSLDDFEVVEGEEPANPDEQTQSGEPHIDTNRH